MFQANVRHINVCTSSIYAADDGTWKLSGFEFLWKSNELTNAILEKSESERYKKAIDENEVKNSGLGIEQYAFGVLCEETLQRLSEGMYIELYEDVFTKYKFIENIILFYRNNFAFERIQNILWYSS